MAMYKLRALPVFVVVALFLFSCKGGKQDNVSPTTGWSYRDPKSSDVNDLGYPIGEASEQLTGPNLVLIEGGTFTMGRVEQDVMFDWNNSPRRVTVSSFYMDETEITNLDYREYLYWLRRVYSDYPEVHRRALPDTLVWRSPLAFNEPYVQYYFRHPSYNNYPVVGVSWLQANDYLCMAH
jgi:gliding motility-associated lipoprotein GldJ